MAICNEYYGWYCLPIPITSISFLSVPITNCFGIGIIGSYQHPAQQGASGGHPDLSPSLAGQFCYQGAWVFAKILGSAWPSPENLVKSLTLASRLKILENLWPTPETFGKFLTLPSEFELLQILCKIPITGQKQLVISIRSLPIPIQKSITCQSWVLFWKW